MIETQTTARGRAVGTSNHASRYTDEQVAQILTLRKKGTSYRGIARIMGCSDTYAFLICNKKLRAQPAVRKLQRLDVSDAGKVAELRAEGHSVKGIARILNVSPHSVEKVLWAIEAVKQMKGA